MVRLLVGQPCLDDQAFRRRTCLVPFGIDPLDLKGDRLRFVRDKVQRGLRSPEYKQSLVRRFHDRQRNLLVCHGIRAS